MADPSVASLVEQAAALSNAELAQMFEDSAQCNCWNRYLAREAAKRLREAASRLAEGTREDVRAILESCGDCLCEGRNHIAEALAALSTPPASPAATSDTRFCDQHQGAFSLKPDGSCLVCALMRHGQDEAKLWAEIDNLKKQLASPRVSAATPAPGPTVRDVEQVYGVSAASRPAQTCATCKHWVRADSVVGNCVNDSVLDMADANCGEFQPPQDFGCTLHEPAPPGPGAQEQE